jgi:hypothetical protein
MNRALKKMGLNNERKQRQFRYLDTLHEFNGRRELI